MITLFVPPIDWYRWAVAFAAFEIEADAVHGSDGSRIGEEMRVQVFHLQKRRGHREHLRIQIE